MKLKETIEYMEQMHRLYGDIDIYINPTWDEDGLLEVEEVAVYHDKITPNEHWFLLSPISSKKPWLRVVK